jgi:hypothetical protein
MLIVVAALLMTAPVASAQTQRISVGEYLGLYDYVGQGWLSAYWFSPDTPYVCFAIDLLGSRTASFGGATFGTTADGSVTIRPMADGRAYVTIIMQVTNVPVWAVDFSVAGAPAFGSTAKQIALLGYTPALGHGIYRVQFTMPSVDTPLPMLGWIGRPDHPEYVLQTMNMNIVAFGPLRAPSGYPDGTPGVARVQQVGLLATGTGATPCPAADCWPVELAWYKPIVQ